MEDRMSNKIQNKMDNKCIKRNKKQKWYYYYE